jgi:hypothetical protein
MFILSIFILSVFILSIFILSIFILSMFILSIFIFSIFILSIFINIRTCNFKLSTCFRITNTKCRINTVVFPDDGHIVAQNMYRLINILRINCAPIWPYLQV